MTNEERDDYKKTAWEYYRENAGLRTENAKLKELCNNGYSSMLKENEQLKWACAAKDADNTMMRSILKRLVRDARAAMGETE